MDLNKRLDKQLKNWELSGQFDKIIKALEKIKPLARTSHQNYTLAAAYVNSSLGNWTKRQNFIKAVQLLTPLENEFGTDFRWYLLMGNALYYLNQWTRAGQYFEIVLEKNPPRIVERATKGLLYECERNVLRADFFEPFEIRVKKAWEEFEKQEQEFYEILKNNPTKWADVSFKAQDIFKLWFEDIYIALDNNEGTFEIILEGNGNPLRLFELQYIRDHAPERVKKKWTIQIGMPPIKDWFTPESSNQEPNHLFLWVDKEEEGIITLNAYCENFDPGPLEPLESAKEHVENLISYATGKCILDKYIEINKIVRTPPAVKTFPLVELREFLNKREIDIHADSDEILKVPVKYNRVPPKVLEDPQYRDDIVSGTTLCMKEIKAYENFKVDLWEKMEADGVTLGCIFYRLDNFTGENREEQIAKFREDFKEELLKRAGPNAIKIIGEAHGRDFDYIDILAWNNKTFINAAHDIFKTVNVPFGGYHPMRRRCGDALLTGENKWIKHYPIDSDPSVNPYVTKHKKTTIQ